MSFKRTVLMTTLICGLIFPGLAVETAASQPDLEAVLLRSLSLDVKTRQRVAPSGQAVKAFIARGIVSRKPNLRFDYNDYRVLRKPAQLFGFTILVIEEEYMAKYVGCCVSPGIGLMLSGNGDLKKLEAFSKANGCSVETAADPSSIPADLKVVTPPGSLTYLSCRERDAAE